MGARTDAARAAAVASRDELADEVIRLEAAARAAVDIPAKIRRAPARTAGAAAGAAFVALGGPRRLLRGVKRAVRGPEAELPRSMLPKEVDKTLRKLGTDGERVRGTLEREFAAYLEEKAPERNKRDLGATTAVLAASVLGPLTKRFGRQLAEQLFTPRAAGGPAFDAAVEKARARWKGARPDAQGGTASGPPNGRASEKFTEGSRDRPAG